MEKWGGDRKGRVEGIHNFFFFKEHWLFKLQGHACSLWENKKSFQRKIF